MPNQTVGTGLDSPDTSSWKPKREQDKSDKAPGQRSLDRQVTAEQKRNANPSS